MEKDLGYIVALGKESELKKALNRGIGSLLKASESVLRPHVCLNKAVGVELINKISEHPISANTEIHVIPMLIQSGRDMWLNLSLVVFLDQMSWPDHVVYLTPRQTGYIIKNLPEEHRVIVLEVVRNWYLGRFLKNVNEGLEAINRQFAENKLLVEDDHYNHVFDIHGGRSMDVPYTEIGVAGEELFWAIRYGQAFLMEGGDGYARADQFILSRSSRQKQAADDLVGLLRSVSILDRNLDPVDDDDVR